MESDPTDPAPSAAADLRHSAAAFIVGSDDSLSSASSSGEIPALPGALAAPAPPPEEEATGAAEVDARGTRRCVGRRGPEMWGAAATAGRRRDMEDAEAVVPEFMDLRCDEVGGCSAAPGTGKISHVRFFGVYDGHGGSQVR